MERDIKVPISRIDAPVEYHADTLTRSKVIGLMLLELLYWSIGSFLFFSEWLETSGYLSSGRISLHSYRLAAGF